MEVVEAIEIEDVRPRGGRTEVADAAPAAEIAPVLGTEPVTRPCWPLAVEVARPRRGRSDGRGRRSCACHRDCAAATRPRRLQAAGAVDSLP